MLPDLSVLAAPFRECWLFNQGIQILRGYLGKNKTSTPEGEEVYAN